jgi:hypothetical protein
MASAAAAPPAHAAGKFTAPCSEFLSRTWPAYLATHPLDPAKHVVVVSVDDPTSRANYKRYARAIAALKREFPSFREATTSGLLLGCCAVPIYGSISAEDLHKLVAAKFRPLCEIGRHFSSEGVGIRAEYRDLYERHEQADAYFFFYWDRRRSPDV